MAEPSWTRADEPPATIEQNWLFTLRRERYVSRRSGRPHDFYVVHLADAVNVVAITPDRTVLLVRQFRGGSARDSLETPGGLVDPGEDAAVAAARELREETGYAGDEPRVLNVAYANPSILTARITTVLIENARRVADLELDAGEEVQVVGIHANLIPGAILRGEVDHALAINALLLWMAAELPNSTLRPASITDAAARARSQFGVSSLMGVVAASAIAFATLARLDREVKLALIGPASLVAVVLAERATNPRRRSVLQRPATRTWMGSIRSFVAIVGAWLSLILLWYLFA